MIYEWDIQRVADARAKKYGATLTLVTVAVLLYFRLI